MAKRSIADPTEPKAPLFIAEWGAPADYSFPQDLRVDGYNGLLLAGIVRYSAGVKPPTKVVSYWCSPSAYDAHGADFRTAAGLKHAITTTVGVQGDIRERHRPQWKNPGFLFGAISAVVGFVVFVVGTLAGFLGDAEKLGQGFMQVSTDPSCVIEQDKFQIVGNREVAGEVAVQEIKIPWYNQTELETIVELADPHLDPPTKDVKLQLQEKSFSLPKHEHKTSSIEIVAPDTGLYTLYRLKFSGRQKAAYPWGHSKQLEPIVSLEVFPILNMRKINIRMVKPRIAELHGELLIIRMNNAF